MRKVKNIGILGVVLAFMLLMGVHAAMADRMVQVRSNEEVRVDSIDDQQMSRKERLALEKRAWTHLGGLYAFVGGEGEYVGVDVGIGDDPKVMFIGGEEYPIKIDEKKGRIEAFDKDGRMVFDGYITNGGNRLEGRYLDKKVRFEGACGH